MSNLWSHLLKALYPSSPYCPACGRVLFGEKYSICPKCAPYVFADAPAYCKICGCALRGGEVCATCYKNVYSYERGVCMLIYNRYSRPIIHSMKYDNNTDLARRFGALLSIDILQKTDILHKVDVIVPVPLAPLRYQQRGYNQAQCIAEGLAEAISKPVEIHALQKTRETADQIGLSRLEREKNLRGSFAVVSDVLKDKNVLLIDDVLTTGSTIQACTKALLDAGCHKVYFAVVASSMH